MGRGVKAGEMGWRIGEGGIGGVLHRPWREAYSWLDSWPFLTTSLLLYQGREKLDGWLTPNAAVYLGLNTRRPIYTQRRQIKRTCFVYKLQNKAMESWEANINILTGRGIGGCDVC